MTEVNGLKVQQLLFEHESLCQTMSNKEWEDL